ncbi:MAG: TonB-dependent receptor [Halieaceae bacterium]
MKTNYRGLMTRGLILSAALSVAVNTSAREAASDSLFDLSLEELLNIQVTGASRKAQKLSETAAAAFVISAEDIERSGATNIPEALRMVPGMHVGQIDGNNYAVSARGSNDRYASKMLMMIDGRTMYTPAYSGVYWDIQQVPMADIERIEVIRGPGTALWGVNAVNGVINVVTRHADDAQGGLAVASTGNQVNHDLTLRWGSTLGSEAAYRVYLQSQDRDGNEDPMGNSTNDTADNLRLGGRIDWQLNESDTLMLTTDGYDIKSGASFNVLEFDPSYSRVRTDDDTDSEGFSVLGRWDRIYDNGSQTTAQAYFDYMDRNDPNWGEDKQTVEFELQHRSLAWDGHDVIGGGTVRYHDLEINGSESQAMDETYYDNLIVSLFLQDEIKFLEDRLSLTLGAKLEHNDTSDSDLEFMPSARLLWNVSPRSSAWIAITSAVRSPAVAEQYGRVSVPLKEHFPETAPDTELPIFVSLEGTGNMKSEDLLAFEAGYRSQISPSFNLDMAFYYNEYQNTRWPKFDGIFCKPSMDPFPGCLADPETALLVLKTDLANASDSESVGAEIAVSWQAREWWQLLGAYSYLDYEINPDGQSASSSRWDVNHLFSLQSRMDLGNRAQFDAWLRYADDVDYYKIDDYWELNLRLSWQLTPNLDLSLHGKNLLESAHPEYESVQRELVPVEIERSYRAEIRFNF